MSHLTMKDLRAAEVPPGAIMIWWIGQASFLFKSPAGALIAADPYLSNSCQAAAMEAGWDCDRLVPVPIKPQELVGVDSYVLTHSHDDHLDPETLQPYRQAGGTGPYVAPAETAEALKSFGIPEDQIVMTWPNKEFTVKDVTLRATFAIPFCGDDLTHVGYLIRVQDGPTVYITGDTAYEDILPASVKEHNPQVMIAVINGLWRNLSAAEAAKLAKEINPEVVIPCHYDMFRSNLTSPERLRSALHILGIRNKYRVLEYAKPYTFPET